MECKQWEKFNKGDWTEEINVRDFIQKNYTPYEGDDSFLEEPTEKTKKLWDEVLKLYEQEEEFKDVPMLALIDKYDILKNDYETLKKQVKEQQSYSDLS